MENKEKVAVEATEPEVATFTVCDFIPVRYSQCCLLCENIRELPEGMHYCNTPWVCDDCKEAIAFVKKQLKHDPLTPVSD